FAYRGDDGFLPGQTTSAGHAAGEIAFVRMDDVNTASAQQVQVLLRTWVIPHIDVHGWGHHHWRGGRQVQSAEEVVADATAELRQDVSRSRSDQEQIRALGNGDVFDRALEISFAA